MDRRTVKRKLRRLLERAVAPAMLIALLAAITMWLVFQHRPSWYRPPVLSQVGLQQARASAVNTAGSISAQMVSRSPFDVVLEDRIVNRWLAALPRAWPEALEAVPPEVSEPVVRFDDGVLHLGVHVARGGWRAIANVSLRLGVSAGKRSIDVALLGAQGGSLPVPRSLLARWLNPELGRLSIPGIALRTNESDTQSAPTSLGANLPNTKAGENRTRKGFSVDDLFDGLSVPNRFTWFNGKRPFRITAIKLEAGKLRLKIEPL